ncbi:hypothetical protein ANACOL_01097 [Anaerotruncus colihominis DSM 17241]|uniref:Uncharacterized protein n=1 Tax=Anaerotruncus colihominis DSM 17241 TaxID=445972 RepID=B0P8K8_9FIRM|nr:hypothetical protein ANACOL_01097 [Anaerotruncus colihominis DSM 17241]
MGKQGLCLARGQVVLSTYKTEFLNILRNRISLFTNSKLSN